MQEITLQVGGMSCSGCVNSVKRLLGQLDGIEHVDVDLAAGSVRVRYDAQRVQPSAMQAAIEGGGYRVGG